MEEKEIDRVKAYDLQPSDLILESGKFETVLRVEEEDDDHVRVFTDDEPLGYLHTWDEQVTLYGY